MRRRLGICLLAALVTMAAACSSDDVKRTDERYCATVRQHLDELNSPNIATPADVERTVNLYRAIADAAPLAVEQEWVVLALAYQTAATVVPSDQASVQRAADTARAAQQSATAIATYTQERCQAQIGPAVVPTTILSASTTIDPDAPSTSFGATTTTPAGTPTTLSGPP